MNTKAALLVLVASLSLVAQQPNGPGATMLINGINGAPWPIQNVSAPTGFTTTIAVSGSASQPFSLAQCPTLSPGSIQTPYGIFDLDYATTEVLLDGGMSTDASGNLTIPVAVPSGAPPGLVMAFQGALIDPTSPVGASMTAATEVTTSVGQITTNLLMGDDTYSQVNLSAHAVELRFYGNVYTDFYVNSNGSITYGAGDGDFTATLGEFLSGQPRVAMLWSDLSPNAGGTVSWSLDFSGASPLVQVDFVNVPDFGGTGGQHTFSCQQQANHVGAGTQLGDVTVIHPATSPASIFDHVVGIGPGGNQSGLTAATDLSAAQLTGGLLGNPNDAIFEFFAGSTTTTVGPSYDLPGITLTWSQLLADQYFLN